MNNNLYQTIEELKNTLEKYDACNFPFTMIINIVY